MHLAQVIRKPKVTCMVIALFCDSGCSSIWPKYARPDVSPESKWHSTDPKTQITHLKLSEMAWWKNFNDPELNALIKKALRNNNDLHVAYANILLARATIQQVQFQWLPSLGIGANGFGGKLNNLQFMNKRTGVSAYDKYGQYDWNYNGYDAGFLPEYNLNLLSQIKLVEISKLDLAK